jgi:hypothetical protein
MKDEWAWKECLVGHTFVIKEEDVTWAAQVKDEKTMYKPLERDLSAQSVLRK